MASSSTPARRRLSSMPLTVVGSPESIWLLYWSIAAKPVGWGCWARFGCGEGRSGLGWSGAIAGAAGAAGEERPAAPAPCGTVTVVPSGLVMVMELAADWSAAGIGVRGISA